MKSVYHPAEERGYFDFGWLNTFHSFSFGRYFDREKMNFGALRVLNDDVVKPGSGFGEHPHDNMEIITIPLSGVLGHKDSTGGKHQLHPNEVQVMSAGSGLTHSEFNHSEDEEVSLLQIWIIPAERGLPPRYEQHQIDPSGRIGKWQELVHPKAKGEGLWINQEAWIHRVELNAGEEVTYELRNKENGVYFFIIGGEADIAGQALRERDAMGVSEVEELDVKASAKTDLIAIEVPMLRV